MPFVARSVLCLSLAATLFGPAYAAQDAQGYTVDCPTIGQGGPKIDNFGNANIQCRTPKPENGINRGTMIFVGNRTLTGRTSYTLSEDGAFSMMFVKNDDPTDPNNKEWMHTFFVFPRRHKVGYRGLENGQLELRLKSGSVVRYSPESATVAEFPGAEYTETAKSFELSALTGALVMDCGIGRGVSPYMRKWASSTLKDQRGQKCVVPNTELFDYPANDRYNGYLKHKTDDSLAGFLSKRCPKLDLSPLRAPVKTEDCVTCAAKATNPPAADENLQREVNEMVRRLLKQRK